MGFEIILRGRHVAFLYKISYYFMSWSKENSKKVYMYKVCTEDTTYLCLLFSRLCVPREGILKLAGEGSMYCTVPATCYLPLLPSRRDLSASFIFFCFLALCWLVYYTVLSVKFKLGGTFLLDLAKGWTQWMSLAVAYIIWQKST